MERIPEAGRKQKLAAGVLCAVRRLHLPIQDPCHEDWDAMARDGETRRFCDICTKQVHDLSAMTQSEARSVLDEESSKGRVCVRYKADTAGNIRFMPERTTPAQVSSVWRMSLAAASLGLMMLTGCADAQPDRVERDRCVYEVGPWSFTAQRGEGSCPEVEEFMLGEVAIEPPPELEPEIMGKMEDPSLVDPEPEPEPEIIELKGDVAYSPELDAGPPAQPCDPPAAAPSQAPSPAPDNELI